MRGHFRRGPPARTQHYVPPFCWPIQVSAGGAGPNRDDGDLLTFLDDGFDLVPKNVQANGKRDLLKD